MNKPIMNEPTIKITIDQYVLWFLQGESFPHTMPGIHFWAETFLIVRNDIIEITMKDGHVLTPEDCFKEMEDCLNKENKEKKVKT